MSEEELILSIIDHLEHARRIALTFEFYSEALIEAINVAIDLAEDGDDDSEDDDSLDGLDDDEYEED